MTFFVFFSQCRVLIRFVTNMRHGMRDLIYFGGLQRFECLGVVGPWGMNIIIIESSLLPKSQMKQFADNLRDHVPPQSPPPYPSPPTPRQCGAVNPLYASKMNPLYDSDDDLDELHGPEAPSKVTQQPNGMYLGGPAAAKGHYQVVDSPPGLPFKANSMYIAADTQDLVEPSDDEYDEVQTNDDADEVAGYLEVDGWANDTYDPTGVHDLRPGAAPEQQRIHAWHELQDPDRRRKLRRGTPGSGCGR